MYSKKKIYLLGANNRAAHTLAEVYKKNNFEIHIIGLQQNNIRYSKFVDQFILLPNAEKDFAAFTKEFVQIFTNEADLLIPVNDVAVLICQQCETLLVNKVKIVGLNLPHIQNFAVNKYSLLLLAQQCNINCPATIYIDQLDEFNKHLPQINFPVIAKPVSSRLLSDNSILGFQVKKFNDQETLGNFVRENINIIPIMLQECIESGYGIGLNFIAQNGELIDYYFHQRIHESWGGGESSYRKTIIKDDFGLVPKAKSIIKQMGWHGVGMLEFRVSNNKAYLMELNGRFWGSIKLGVFSGKNFPLQLLQLGNLQKGERSPGTKVVYARNFKMEVLWLIRGVVQEKKILLPLIWLWNCRKAFRSVEMVEDSLFADFKYRFLDMADIILIPLSKKISAFKEKKVANNWWKKIAVQQYKPVKNHHIVFVCKGNICRSPFAEMYANKHYPGFSFYSTGFINRIKRLPPLSAVTAARDYEVNSMLHQSTKISSIDSKLIDAWFVMDKGNLVQLINKVPGIDTAKIFSLGGHKEIEDPFSKPLEFFDNIFAQISVCIDKIFR
ncbi:hypothetical protein BH11BAC3_BH11BAC3_01320 [soil metagenome]